MATGCRRWRSTFALSGQFELPAPELTEEEIKRQEFLKKERIRSRERYQKLKSGERIVGVPVNADLQMLRAGSLNPSGQIPCSAAPTAGQKFYGRRRQRAAVGRVPAKTAARWFPTNAKQRQILL